MMRLFMSTNRWMQIHFVKAFILSEAICLVALALCFAPSLDPIWQESFFEMGAMFLALNLLNIWVIVNAFKGLKKSGLMNA